MSWYNPFNVFGKKEITPFELVESIHAVWVYPLPGSTKKDIIKDLNKIFGKNLENRVISIDEMFEVEPSYFMDRSYNQLSTAAEMFEKMSTEFDPSHHSNAVISGFIHDIKAIENVKSCKVNSRDCSSYNREQLTQCLQVGLQEYSRKSGDKSIFSGKVPDECPSCNCSFVSEWEDEDLDEREPVAVDNGCCGRCGYFIEAYQVKDLKKAYKLIRKFEEDKGIHILPRVEIKNDSKAVKSNKKKAA